MTQRREPTRGQQRRRRPEYRAFPARERNLSREFLCAAILEELGARDTTSATRLYAGLLLRELFQMEPHLQDEFGDASPPPTR